MILVALSPLVLYDPGLCLLEQPDHGLHVAGPLADLLASLRLRSAGGSQHLSEVVPQTPLFVQNNPVLQACKVRLYSLSDHGDNHNVGLENLPLLPRLGPLYAMALGCFHKFCCLISDFFTAHTSSSQPEQKPHE